MDKPSVTIKNTAYYTVGILTLVFAAFVTVSFLRQGEDPFRVWSFAALLGIAGLFLIACGTSTQTIDENGVAVKFLFWERGYDWSEVVEVGIAKGRRNSRKVMLTISGGRLRQDVRGMWAQHNLTKGHVLHYNSQVLDCIRYYYGELDFNEFSEDA